MRSSLQRSLSHFLVGAIIASVALIAPLSPIASSPASAATVAPQAPTAVVASGIDSTNTNVSWTVPSGEVSSYTVSVVGEPTLGCTATSPATSCGVKGLSAGVSYRFTVKANNEVGSSPDSNQSAAFVPTAAIFLNSPTILPNDQQGYGDDSLVVNGHIWVVSGRSKSVLEFSEAGPTLLRTIVFDTSILGITQGAIATNGSSIFVLGSNIVTELNESTGAVIQTLSYPGATAITVTNNRLWVLKSSSNQVKMRELDGSSQTDFTVTVGNAARNITSDSSYVWVANYGAGTVTQIDAKTKAVVRTITVGGTVENLASNGTTVWVSYWQTWAKRELAAIDVATGVVRARVTKGLAFWTYDLTADNDFVYVAASDWNGVSVLDATSGGWLGSTSGYAGLFSSVGTSIASNGGAWILSGGTYNVPTLSRLTLFTPRAPQAPSDVIANPADDGGTEVSWVGLTGTAATGGRSISSYKVSAVGETGVGCTTTDRSYCSIPNLTIGKSYRFTVTATNSVGTSLNSDPSPAFVPVTAPAPLLYIQNPTLLPVDTGGQFSDLLAVNSHIWITNPSGKSLLEYSETGPTLLRTVTLDTEMPYKMKGAIATNGSSIFVLGTNIVTEVNESTGAVIQTLSYPGATAITVTNNRLWVLKASSNQVKVRELDGSSQTDSTVVIGNDARDIASDGSSVWVANYGDNSVTQINAQTKAVVRTIALIGTPEWVASNGTTLWVSTKVTGKRFYTLVDVATGAVRTRISRGVDCCNLRSIGIGGDYFYQAGPRLAVFDANTGAFLGELPSAEGVFSNGVLQTNFWTGGVTVSASGTPWFLHQGNYLGSHPTLSRLTGFTPRAPLAPTDVRASRADNGATYVSWFPLAGTEATGGRSITSYNVSAVGETGVGCTATSDQASCTIQNLTIGKSYRFTVTATNSVGTSDSSLPSPSFVPSQTPTTQLRVTTADTFPSGSCGTCGGNDTLEVNGHLWVAYTWDSAVLEYDLNGMNLIRKVTGVTGGDEGGAQMATDGTSIFVRGGGFTQIDEATGTIVKTYTSANNGRSVGGITVANGLVWFYDYWAARVIAVDPSDFHEVYVVRMGYGATSIASDSRYVWLANAGEPTITQIDASTGTIVRSIAAGNTANLASNGTMLWALSWSAWARRDLVGIDVATGAVVTRVNQALPFWTRDIAVDDTKVYVVNDCYSGVGIYDATSGEWLGTKGSDTVFCPSSVSAGAGGAWVTHSGAVNGGAGTRGTVSQLSVYNPRMTVAPADRAVVASWSGIGADHYEVSSPDGSGRSCVTTESSCRITGLKNGVAYNLVLKAYDADGTLVETLNSSSVTPAGLPGVATNVFATSGNKTATVTFSAAPSNGASVSYVVTASPGGATCATSTTSCTFAGLANDTPYSFSVLATNSQGNGPASEASNSVTPSAVPLPIGDLVAWADDSSALIRWSNPTTTYGQELTAYVVSDGIGHSCATVNTSCVVTGLTNGQSYQFTVTAYYETGVTVVSAVSNSVGLPGKPKLISGVKSAAGDGSLAISWTAVKTAGARYVVVADDGTSCATTSTSCILLGLDDGTTYTYAVYASTPDGAYWSSNDFKGTPVATVPDAPTDVSLSVGDGRVAVSWNRPDANGSPILEYTASDGAGHTCKSTEAYCVITGLGNGVAATITVTARNSVGSSLRSQGASGTPMAVPGAPKNLLAVSGDGQVMVSWQAPDGVGADTSYAVVGAGDASDIYCITTTTSCVVTGLVNGTSYAFAVTTRTAHGVSLATSVTNQVTPSTVPTAPTILNTIASSGSVVVTFTTPANNGGSSIVDYLVVSSLGDDCTTTSNMCRFDGLANGQPLTFTVVARNAIGSSDESAPSAVVTPRGVADTPRNVAALAGDGLVKVSWQAPADNGGSAILRYTVTDGAGHSCQASARLTCTINGLTNGASYTFSVIAVNGVGNSLASSVTVTPTTAPSVPTGVSASVKNTTATIRWTASNGWGRDVSYIVSDGTGFECRTSSVTCQITGLSYGDVRTFTVVAVSDSGVSATSIPSNTVTPAAAPSAPGTLQAVAGKQLVVLSWTAATTNGAAITQYLVSDGAGHTCSTTALTCTVTDLTGGTAYTFKVRATNGVGDSPWSKAATATPAAPPSAPAITMLTPGDAKFLVNFDPAAGNGSAVSAYYYSFDGGTSKFLADWTVGKKFFTVSGLTNGTNYSFQMAASNTVGLGVWSTISGVTPLTTPGAPTLTTAIASTNSIALTFQAPTSNGGSVITSYAYSLDGGTTWLPRPSGTTSLSFTISGLAGKTTYRVALRAVNKAGSGTTSKVITVTTR